jgi:hypothetical protein
LGMGDDKKAHHHSSGCPHMLFYLILSRSRNDE